MGNQEELVLVTANKPSIHYSTGDYYHFQSGINEAWVSEILATATFVPRWMAEQDSSILQLIPYVILTTPDKKMFSYQRRGGGEGRLEGKHSVGIGGHVNISDKRKGSILTANPEAIGWATVEQGATREILEEVDLSPRHIRENISFFGTIYTPVNSDADLSQPGPTVGQVHLGIVYVLPLPGYELRVKEEDNMINHKFIYDPLDLSKYERWSQLVIKDRDLIRDELTKRNPNRI